MSLTQLPVRRPLVIGHRGAPGYRPELTLAAFQHAIRLGADRVELDLVMTADGTLVARHENELGASTDVAGHACFADRRRTATVAGQEVTGWFSEDFTLAELRRLRAVERMPRLRPANTAYDGAWPVPTFDEVLQLVAEESARAGREIGVHAEVKDPGHFAGYGLSALEALLGVLRRRGLDDAGSPVVVQSFDPGFLRGLAACSDVPLVQLVGRGPRRRRLVTTNGLAWVASYAHAVGVHRDLVLPPGIGGATGSPSSLVVDAHEAGLAVHVWTLREENRFLPRHRRRGRDPRAHGDGRGAARDLLACGVDGLITDYPDVTAEAVASWWEGEPAHAG